MVSWQHEGGWQNEKQHIDKGLESAGAVYDSGTGAFYFWSRFGR